MWCFGLMTKVMLTDKIINKKAMRRAEEEGTLEESKLNLINGPGRRRM